MDYINQYRKYVNLLVKDFKYKPLPKDISKQAREYYERMLEFFNMDPSKGIFDLRGAKISNGYDRIVVGDYGAFIEINSTDICKENIVVLSGQEFRLDPDFNGKYLWYTTNGSVKIYYQVRTVKYADYKVGFYYVSPTEIKQGENHV